MRRIIPILFCLTLPATPAWASGVNLAWGDCGANGLYNLAWACNTDIGANVLVGSVVPPPGIGRFIGFEAVVDLQAEGSRLPDWWQLENGCRAGRISADFNFVAGPFSCRDPWQGQAYGGMQYEESVPGGQRARILLAAAVSTDQERSLSPGTEYYLFKLIIPNMGTGGCDGCRTGVCLLLSSVLLVQPALVGDYLVDERANMNAATWQGGISSPDSELNNCRTDAVQNRSWGQVKSLYR